ncbi:hypothetical protein GCM10022409_06620 [Hymenobacter glaciei]|uniref:Uncharacterized protein n=1 Tax=Hymenobacter glaciei TaxID=877209 RepID=A0ABP7TF17_9BACT
MKLAGGHSCGWGFRQRASLYDEMTRNINAGESMANGPRDAASTTPTTLEEFAKTVFAPVLQAATATPVTA